MIWNKNKNKDKFVNRGLYFVSSGANKGCFLLYMSEFSSSNSKTLSQFPEGIKVDMTNDEVKKAFEKSHFEFVKVIPKRVYQVCVAQYTKGEAK